MRKKIIIPTLGLTERAKKSAGLGKLTGGVHGRAIITPGQEPLMPPSSDWVRPRELPDLHGIDEIGLDTEGVDNGLARGQGPGWAFKDGHVAGVGVAWRQGAEMHRIYAPVAHPDSDNFDKDAVARWVAHLFKAKRVVFFNAGYDIGWLHADMGVSVPPVIDDASCAAFLIDENREDLSLDGVCEWRGVPGKDLAELRAAARAYGYPEKDAVKIIGKLPARYAAAYGSQDPASTLLLMEDLRLEMARQGLMRAYQTEMRLVPLTHAMRRRGIRINIDRAVAFQGRLQERVDRALRELSDNLHQRVGIDEVRSHLWLNKTFSMESVPIGLMRGGKASFDKDWMRRAKHWLPRLCAEVTQCTSMADKFIGNYLLDFAHNGRVHASVNQWLYEEGGTRSHRLSYSNPPLQQAPSRPEMFDGWPLTGENAKEYRACFEPEEGELWFSPDYSQQEYRHIVADADLLGLSKADEAAEEYRNNPKADFHNIVVTLTGLTRYFAKQCNFAKVYGAGVPKFATMIDKPVEEAAKTMGTYDKELPFVKQLSERCTSLADKRGYIKMYDGARSHFDLWEVSWLSYDERSRGFAEGYKMSACSIEEARERQKTTGHPWQGERIKRAFTHKAMNRRIQGNAARQMKEAMATCGDEGYVPLLQMHDELSFSFPPTAAGRRSGERVEEIMRTTYLCSVPFLVDAEWGTTWGDAKHTHEQATKMLKKQRAT